ncbi:lipoprotein [Actinoplanes sp. CA-030573]|uniref:lipoprotein n=1 Tax=Actinoplanes sp. CA-030573 TaxID=3239898 RepID=UPI003D8EA28A
MRHVPWAASAALLLSALLTGCSDHAPPAAPAPPPSTLAAAWGTDPAPAAAAGKPGACKLPVTFDVAKSWKASSVPDGVADQGGFALRCEIDAKPAGHIGFLRVWVGDGKAEPGAALDAYLAEEPGVVGRQTRTVKAGDLPAAEATYLTENAELGVRRQERALAVATGTSTVLLVIGGLSPEEHRELLPAYVLARQTLTLP